MRELRVKGAWPQSVRAVAVELELERMQQQEPVAATNNRLAEHILLRVAVSSFKVS